MKIDVHLSERSTLARPLWIWRVWHGGRAVKFGTAATEQEARQAATVRASTVEQKYSEWCP